MPIIDDQALEAHIQALSLRVKAEVCSMYVENFKRDFNPRFQSWQAANAELLLRGAVVAKDRGMDSSKPPGIEAFARMQADLLSQLPADDRTRRCEEILTLLLENHSK